MARHQYRLAGTFEWFGSSGSALVALTNKLGSNRKVTIRSLQIASLTAANNATAGAVTSAVLPQVRVVHTGGIDGGVEVVAAPMDTAAAAWPSTVRVLKDANCITSGWLLHRVFASRSTIPSTQAFLTRTQGRGPTATGVTAPRRNHSGAVTKTLVRAGETWALQIPVQPEIPFPVRVTLTLRRQGSPARTWVVEEFVVATRAEQALIALVNDSGSGETFEIVSWTLDEVGTFDSPYFQVVPVGTMDATAVDDPAAAPPILKMDTADPDPTTFVQVFQDTPFLPRDVPEQALSDASTGSPKGSNYLKAKDFLGPVYRVLFPEYAAVSTLRAPDSLHHHLAPKRADVGIMRAGIVIRPGEGIALVSAAETAAIATAVGLSGWNAYEVSIAFDVEPLFQPTLRITGLQNPSEVRIFTSGGTFQFAGEENVTDGVFEWEYDPAITLVDISILSLGYQNLRLLSVALTPSSDVTIPVQQQIDRQYENA